MPTIGTNETSIKVPYGVYVITLDNPLIEVKFDSKLSTVISNSDDFDTEFEVFKSVISDFDTKFIVNKDINTLFDTKYGVVKPINFDSDTSLEIVKTINTDSDTKFIVNKDIDTPFDTSLEIIKTINSYSDTSFEIIKTINPDSDTELKISKDIDTPFDTSLEIVKTINSYSDISRTVLKEMNVLFDTKCIVKKDGEPDPEEDIVAKFVRTLAFAKTSNANFRGNTGNSHFYYPVSLELIKTMLERNFLVYEQLETPLDDGTTEVELNLNNYDKPTGGVIISKEQARLLTIIQDIELQTSRQYNAEMQEYLRQVGLEIKRQQDEISGF